MAQPFIFAHRVNSLIQLRERKEICSGFECDIRYNDGKIVLCHDLVADSSYTSGDELFPHASGMSCIANIKETGGEINIIKSLLSDGVQPLLLDAPIPACIGLIRDGYAKYIIWRLSEYEQYLPCELKALGIEWIWLDSFNHYWFDKDFLNTYHSAGIKICLVSNELQGRPSADSYGRIKSEIHSGIISAVCTKKPEFYMEN